MSQVSSKGMGKMTKRELESLIGTLRLACRW